jgi:hypothetical protein
MHWLQGGWYPRGLIVHQLRYRLSDSNKNVDIQFSVHDWYSKAFQLKQIKNEN